MGSDVGLNAHLGAVLDESGYAVDVSTSAAQALAKLVGGAPDMVLLDVRSGDSGGFDLARRFQAATSTAYIPVIFLVELSQNDHWLHALDAGGVDCVTKPVRSQEVLARMALHLAGARERRQTRNALDAFGYATMTVRPQDGKLMWQTPLARDLLERYCPAHPPYASYTAPEVQAWLQECLRSLRSALAPRPLTLNQASGSRLTLRLHQQTGDNEALATSGAPTLQEWESDDWLIVMREVSDRAGMEAMRQAFGLTAREAEVLYWVVKGKTNKDVGDILGSSPMTVKKHLERVFVKLGVETRTAAAGKVTARTAPQWGDDR
ncbi:MAG: DNA-binding response regulator [Betaproteobacteria bacterium]